MSQVRLSKTAVHRVVSIAILALLLLPETASAGDTNRAYCSNEMLPGFRSYLPDCRAYEMVTPPFKDGFPVSVEGVSEDGSRMWILSLGTYANPEGVSQVGGVYEVSRTSSEWTSTPMDAPFSMFAGYDVVALSSDFSTGLWYALTPSSTFDPYLVTVPRGPFTFVGPGAPGTAGGGVLNFIGASRDLSHSLFRVRAPGHGQKSQLWPGDTTVGAREPSLYEYAGVGNSEPRLVGVSDEHKVARIEDSHLISDCGTYLGGPGENTYNAVSESGTTIFFTAVGRDYGECGGLSLSAVEPPVNEVYARLNASTKVAISEPSKTDCDECELSPPADAEFQGASLDGSKVFFTTTQHLLPNSAGEGSNLYEYDFDGPPGARVTLVSKGDPAGARVQSVVRVSEDGSHIYFLAQGVLTAAANVYGAHAEEGAQNLYVYERDAAHPPGHLTFVAAGGIGTAQATPNGRFLVFESAADLTPDQEGRAEAGQVFEYDAQSATLVRISRGQRGYNEDGNTSSYPATIPEQNYLVGIPTNQFTGLAVSEDGAYVFFTSEDGLTPQALSGVVNVYEYHEGQVALISDGHDSVSILEGSAVELVGTNESGQDVFFRTADRLVPQDGDTQVDIYDARSEGGFPAPAVEPSCAEDPCQGPLAGALSSLSTPTSSSGGEGALPVVPAKTKPAPKRPKVKAKVKKRHHRKHTRRAKKAAESGGR